MVYCQCFLQIEVSFCSSDGIWRKVHLPMLINVVFFLLFWFTLNFRLHFTNEQMALVCLVCTLAAVLPSCIHLFFNARKDVFLLSLINTSLAFFLLSFQVNYCQIFHKKVFCFCHFNSINSILHFIYRFMKNPFYS